MAIITTINNMDLYWQVMDNGYRTVSKEKA